MEKESSFLERLTFDASLNQTTIAGYFKNIRTIVLVVLTLTGAGLATFFSLPRELNPNIQIPIVFVSTPFPGAGPEDVENLITIPLEDAVSGLSGVEKVSSVSQENISTLNIEFSSGTDPEQAKQDVQSALDGVSNLPPDAESPKVQVLDFQNQPVLNFVLSGADGVSLNRFADSLKEEIQNLSGVEKVTLSYRKEEEVSLILKPEVLTERSLSPLTIAGGIEQAIANHPAGTVSTDTTSFALTQSKSADSLESLRALPLSLKTDIVRLGDIATIRTEGKRNAPESYYADATTEPTRGIVFSVFKTDTADATTLVSAILSTNERLRQTYEEQFVFEPIFDGAKEIKKSFDQLFHDFAITILLVFIVLFTFFGLRQSIIAALAIPLTFLGTFLVMSATGISINFIALFSLLLALGILVDNAIVIISAMASYERTKKFSPAEVALLVWRDFKAVIFTTTITTVWAFLPLLLASGIIGEFIKPIPIVVSSALAISAAVALFIVIPLMAMLLRGNFPRRVIILVTVFIALLLASLLYLVLPAGPWHLPLFLLSLIILFLMAKLSAKVRGSLHTYEASHFTRSFETLHRLSDQGIFNFDPLAHRYEHFIASILRSKQARRRTIAALIIFTLCSYALVPLGLVVNEFFPEDNQDTIYVSVVLPKSTTLPESTHEGLSLLSELRSFPESRFALLEIGAAPPTDNFTTGKDWNNLLITLIMEPAKTRSLTSGEIVATLNRDYASYTAGTFTASQLSGGPPAGSDIELKLRGENLSELQAYGEKVSSYLASQPGITNVSTSITSGASKIVFTPDQTKLTTHGIGVNDTAFLLRTLGSGFTIKNDARIDNDKFDIVLRLGEASSLEDPTAISLISVPTRDGTLPLTSLGDLTLAPNPTLITREDGKRTLSVSAGVSSDYSVSTINADLEKFADTLNLKDGYDWKTGGVNDENNKSVQSILQAMLLSSILIFGTMAIQFNSFRKALIVLLVVPLAISGVFIMFSLFGIPLSFPALIGILALFGIVVNNSIIMVDKINKNMDSGLPLAQAISEGAASRLEPILLTALTTIVGLIPITLSDPIWQGLGGAIIAGLTFSGVAKLFFIPVVYYMWFSEKETPAQPLNDDYRASFHTPTI
jgi:HAE1 family hydrophobic/amphiphilic exporter-1